MKRIDGSDLMTILGLALLCGGLRSFDWRLALIACGLVLLLLGLASDETVVFPGKQQLWVF